MAKGNFFFFSGHWKYCGQKSHNCKAASPSPVAEAVLGLEGTGIVATSQAAALVAAQRRDQVDGTWNTHGSVNRPTSDS